MMRLYLPVLVVLVWIAVALLGHVLPLTPDLIALEHILDPPSTGAVLGHDDLGRDIAARLMVGAHTSLLVAVWVVGLSVLVGTLVGTFTAYRGGWWDQVIMQVLSNAPLLPFFDFKQCLFKVLALGIIANHSIIRNKIPV